MALHGLSALLLDDDPSTRIVAGRILAEAGMEILEAADSASALRIVREKRPHLVFAALALPGGESGFEFLDHLKHSPDLQNIPVVVLSSHADLHARTRAAARGARDFIAKPFDAAILLQKARKQLRDREFVEVDLSGTPYVARLELPCTVLAAGAGGVEVESSVRAEPGAPLRFYALELCAPLGIDLPFPLFPHEAHATDGIGFRSTLRFRGLTRAQRLLLEEVIARWHT